MYYQGYSRVNGGDHGMVYSQDTLKITQNGPFDFVTFHNPPKQLAKSSWVFYLRKNVTRAECK